ncbi:MAG: tripartite tricarboxylate transporter TctB family protein [Gammaproteobacteria bacterium]|nr:tripartite tricarboxylate transporter TctB family protein [Gammaproteobacteria bacterium]
MQTDHTENGVRRDVSGMVTAAVFILIAVIALWDTTNMVDADSYVFPRAVAIAMIIFCMMLIAWGLIRPLPGNGEASDPGASTVRRVSLVLAMLVSTALMPWLGFLISGFAAFISIMVIAMYDQWTPFRKLVYPLVCAAFVVGFYFLFAELLLVPLPVGSLFE